VVADQPRLYRLAYGILRDPQLAEDATQQALLDIWRDVGRLRDPAKYEGWSYRLLVRVCYAESKRQQEWATSHDLPSAIEPRAADVYGGVADRDQLERGFRRLSMDHRVVLALRHLLGMTPDEVAVVLDLPRTTVYSRLQAAAKAMRAALEAEGRSGTVTLEPQEAVR
jgi:RNA polymerase sigma-70 factor, ECF subfamily